MSSLETLREFLGWCTVINMGILLIAAIVAGPMRGVVSGIYSKMYGLSEADLSRAYFQYLAHYKIAIYVFNLVPYIALVIIA
jgi:Zn-dependent protease